MKFDGTVELTQVITWLIVFAGWYIINEQNKRRETRKEVRQSIDTIAVDLDAITDLAYEYHSTRDHDSDVSQRIKYELLRLEKSLNRLKYPISVNVDAEVIGLRRAITFKNFDTAEHVALSSNDELFNSISESVCELREKLESSYSITYH